ncbi:cytochrome b561 [Kitasatospora herbaricolor]|uniref:COX15/CtaA family protein n=1 Tax=Kitasatospora herbaricolor TaxID=68217 RepID=UPI0019B6171F|nr:COX15/CtaA family protein [Kitasatospora herbaricolor]MDQ0311107.1 cytochrome c oxidase assembly protein subunit 15 [Kitasatospora herbaricolor]GGV11962.1 cytochrome b561 [Kitasatospora herbaricolor]
MRTPSSLLAERWQPSAVVVRRAALAALVMSIVIVVTGGAVRLSASGLGCTTWPRCTGESLTPTPEMGLHGVIEFTNRMLTYVLCAAVGWAILAARCAAPWRRGLTRLGWAQFWLVMSNAVIGGITVLTGLNPYTVAVHLISAMALVWVALLMWERSKEGDGPPRGLVARPIVQLSHVLVTVIGLLVAAGTLVTGAGHHPGTPKDNRMVPRIPLDYDRLAQVHADLAFVSVGLAVAVLFVFAAVKAPPAARARARELLVVLLAQGVLGFVQYFTDVPEVLVGVHMLGATLTWIAVLRVPLALRVRTQAPAAGPAPVPAPTAAATV